MSAVFTIFNLLTLLYIFRSAQLGLTIWRERALVREEPLTQRKKYLGEQAAFFIAVPISVFVHEFGHVLAIWWAGGQVVEFGYRVFWGYVVPQGVFTAAENWFIALAGTLGSLAFGLVVWLALRHNSVSSLRYFSVRTLRFQVYFSLIYYPLFTLLGFQGDWRTIYDFQSTPILSAATAVAQILLLALFWYGDRLGWFEAPAFETTAAQERFQQLQKDAAAYPQDAQRQISYIDALRRAGAQHKAKHLLKQYLAANPQSAIGHLQMAALLSESSRRISRDASEHAEEAINLGLPQAQQRSYAHEIVARFQLEVGQVEQAINHLTQAVTAVAPPSSTTIQTQTTQATRLAYLYNLRNQAYRRNQRYDEAYQDIKQAIHYAQIAGDQQAVLRYRNELQVLSTHSGRQFAELPLKT